MLNRFNPEILYACPLAADRPWWGFPGGLLFVRTPPLPRTCGELRLSVRAVICPAPCRRFTLRPLQVSEEGLLVFRLPRAIPPQSLLALRLCLDSRAGAPKFLRVLPAEAF